MSCGCSTGNKDGREVVDFVRSKGKAEMPTQKPHEMLCSCGKSFVMEKVVDQCPHCKMTYGVTPCSSGDKENIQAAGIDY